MLSASYHIWVWKLGILPMVFDASDKKTSTTIEDILHLAWLSLCLFSDKTTLFGYVDLINQDHSVYTASQSDTALPCNATSHRLAAWKNNDSITWYLTNKYFSYIFVWNIWKHAIFIIRDLWIYIYIIVHEYTWILIYIYSYHCLKIHLSINNFATFFFQLYNGYLSVFLKCFLSNVLNTCFDANLKWSYLVSCPYTAWRNSGFISNT